MSNPYVIAVYGGFVVVESYDTPHGKQQKLYTISDSRSATPFDTFEKADATAKWAVGKLYPPDLRYFAIFVPAIS